MKRRLPLWSGFAVASGFMVSPLAAQGLIQQWNGDAGYQFMGHAVAAAGDIDGDGYADVLVGAPGDNGFGQDSGLARLYSGQTGAQLREWTGTNGFDELGSCVAGVGDINGDGVPDLLIGTPNEDTVANGAGRVRVYSGANYALLHTMYGQADKDYFGISAAGLGDVDGDGFGDFVVGAWEYLPGINPGPGKGYADVYSGRTGTLIYRFDGAHNTAFMGRSVGGPGDVNGDGRADILVGAYGEDNGGNNTGRVYLYSGIDGSVIYTWDGQGNSDKLGISVAGAGDVNNDGVPDVIAGAYHNDLNGNNAGMAQVFSGADGSLLYTWYGDNADDLFGQSVDGGQDLNGDGFDDLLVGIRHDDTIGDNSGAARAYSGADGSELFTAYGLAQDDLLGFSVAMSADISGDGVPDIIVGGTQYNDGPGPGNGMVQALDPTTGPPPPPPPYPNLPTTFESLATGYSDGFEVHAGTVPSHMAINELSASSRMTSTEAFCNIGQNAACTGGISGVGPRTGSFGLEMGGLPGATISGPVANGLVIGLNGAGSTSYELDFYLYNFGEEPDNDDGVWVSDDGEDWERVLGGWSGRPQDQWVHITGVDLGSTSVDISGDFYLLFAENENNPLGEDDGILIDDINIAAAVSGYRIDSVLPGTAGALNQVAIEGATPGQGSTVAYDFRLGSFTVPGCGVTVDLRVPKILATVTADGTGHAELNAFVPLSASGLTVYLQAVELSTCQVTDLYTLIFP